jgi:hypothetical protein
MFKKSGDKWNNYSEEEKTRLEEKEYQKYLFHLMKEIRETINREHTIYQRKRRYGDYPITSLIIYGKEGKR